MRTPDPESSGEPPDEQLLREIYSAFPGGLLIYDRGGRVQIANDATGSLLDCQPADLIGRNIRDLFPPEGLFTEAELQQASEHSFVPRTERILHTQEDRSVPLVICASILKDADGALARVLCSLTEIGRSDSGETSDLDYQRGHTQRLEWLGKITAGIAHEINTPVQFIGDSVAFLEEAYVDLKDLLGKYAKLCNAAKTGSIDPALIREIEKTVEDVDLDFLEEEIPNSIKRTLEGVSRVAEITRAVKEFSYRDKSEKVAVDLNGALMNTLTVARNEYKYVAKLETDLADLPPVFCHIGQLNQVFVNLVVNAADAIADAGGRDSDLGTIRITTSCKGEYVLISLSDTGTGIPEHVREKIFDPFFTTKQVGKGSNYCLSFYNSIIVDRHFGTLEIETECGRGTTFFIRLPVDGETRLGGE